MLVRVLVVYGIGLCNAKKGLILGGLDCQEAVWHCMNTIVSLLHPFVTSSVNVLLILTPCLHVQAGLH